MNDLYLTSPIPPSVNHYLCYRAIMKNGKPMAMSYRPKEVVDYRKYFSEYVIQQVKEQGYDYQHDGSHHFYVDGIFYMPKINLDSNNLWKVMLDAITDTQLVWKDDNVVCERVQAIYYDADNPRIELHIYPTDYIGVFEDTLHLEMFKKRCLGCTRCKRNCSILANAIQGRVSDDIRNGVCLKFKELKDKNKGD